MDMIIQTLAEELGQKQLYIENVVKLLDEGNTIPFIARYRKEMHGSMDDTTLRNLETRLQYLRNLQERKGEVLKSIENQGKLTEELTAAIEKAATLAEIEDIYRPYKQKRRTRATVAKEKGLEPLAQTLFLQDGREPTALAVDYVDPEKGVETVEDALAGASDIIAEMISDDADIRKALRQRMENKAVLTVQAADPENDSVYRTYYEFSSPVARLQNHQILAINRGEKEEFLKVAVTLPGNEGQSLVCRMALKPTMWVSQFVKAAAEDAYNRLIAPSAERELRNTLTERAGESAIANFALNLKPLLMQRPVKGFVTMGLDPGYRNVERLKGQVDVAAILGAKVMRHDVCYSLGKTGASRSFGLMLPTIADGARQVTAYAETLGIKTCTENHGYIAQDSYRVEQLFNAVAHDNYGLLVDIGNFVCADEDPALAVSRVAPYAVHVHLKDMLYRSAPSGNCRNMTRGGNYFCGTVVGEGDVPVKQCLRIIKATGYDGFISLEYEGAEDCLTGIARGLANVKKMLAELQ